MGIKKSILFLGITISIFSILGGTTDIQNVSGHGNIDQSSTGPFNNDLGLSPSSTSRAQSFTPTVSNLVAVDIFMADDPLFMGFSDTVTVNIRTGSHNGPILDSSTKTVTTTGATFSNPRVEHFDFSPSVGLTSGVQHFIQIDTGASAGVMKWVVGDDLYPGGTVISFGTPDMDSDHGFITYFEDVPVGGSLVPIDTTSLLLAGTQMTAAWMIPAIIAAIGIGIVIARKL